MATKPATERSDVDIDGVLPLVRSDAERANLLLESLGRFFPGFGRLFVVAPARDLSALEETLRPPSELEMTLVAETQVAPELEASRARGWYKQQLVKLAIYEHVNTSFYLTFDADVVATRPVAPEDLVVNGRGLCHVIPEDLHPDWYRDTERFLARPLRRRGVLHAVTPALLATDAVRALVEAQDRRAREGRWSRGRAGWRQRWGRARGRQGWRSFLLDGLPWTEYALYHSWLELEGLADRYHHEAPPGIYDVERSVWKKDADRFDAWDPSPLFRGEGPPWFAVIQSNTRLAPSRLREKLEPFLR